MTGSDHGGHVCKPTMPPRAVIEWVKLAEKYEHAGLGNGMSDQTRHALAGMRTFLHQPAEAYCWCHYTEAFVEGLES